MAGSIKISSRRVKVCMELTVPTYLDSLSDIEVGLLFQVQAGQQTVFGPELREAVTVMKARYLGDAQPDAQVSV
jgi:hypothetical protein